jgi:DnaJ-domain-containing protein 1
MSEADNSWRNRARRGLNVLIDRVNAFEAQGGLSAAVQRGLERARLEQERIRRDAREYGPLAHLQRIRQAYARLEVPFGSDFETVRRSYRSLMRKYHPDRHASDPEREKLATEISQKLTVAYDMLSDRLH